jgi:hypothetical protein
MTPCPEPIDRHKHCADAALGDDMPDLGIALFSLDNGLIIRILLLSSSSTRLPQLDKALEEKGLCQSI